MTIATRLVDVAVNVKSSPYNAKGDAKKLTQATFTNGLNIINDTTAQFVNAPVSLGGDIGKVCWGVRISTKGLCLAKTTITGVNSATQCTTQANATATVSTPGQANFIYGSDDTAALQAAAAAARPHPLSWAAAQYNRPKNIIIPYGGYIVTALPFDFRWLSAPGAIAGPSLIGDGRQHTMFYAAPGFDFSSAGPNYGMFAAYANVENSDMIGLGFDGCGYNYGGLYNFTRPLWYGSGKSKLRDVRVDSFMGIELARTESFEGEIEALQVLGGDGNGLVIGGTGGTFRNIYAGNCQGYSVLIQGINGANNTGMAVRFFGGTIDESTLGGCNVTTSTDVRFDSTILFGPDNGKFALTLDATSKVNAVGSLMVPYGTTAGGTPAGRSGVKLAAGAVFAFSHTRIAGVGTAGEAYNNLGTMYDCGGNEITGTRTGNAPVAAALA